MPETELPEPLRRAKAVLHAFFSFEADVLLAAFYYLALAPTAWLVRLSGRDGLGLKDAPTGWTAREAVDPAEHMAGQG
ncbi:MAG: hypothetical protein HY077_10100 [Elusimicrobia bacterium]|nr:hypothetical protein [Elusimicrobiota bacterium]